MEEGLKQREQEEIQGESSQERWSDNQHLYQTYTTTTITTGDSSMLLMPPAKAIQSLVEEGEDDYQGLLESNISYFDRAKGSHEGNNGDEKLDDIEKDFNIKTHLRIVTKHQDGESWKNETTSSKQEQENEIKLDLEQLVKKPDRYEFYCPNCESCITTVVLRERNNVRGPGPGPGPEPKPKPGIVEVICSFCYKLVTPIRSLCSDCFPPSGGLGLRKLDILKCIVYGGLTESITSLGVVISAASADAATLNILALGLANLVGGLFIIGHNLWELKNDQYFGEASKKPQEYDHSQETTNQVDRYEDLLGQRGNFFLHATVAVLSFLVFGLVPLVTFAFSFLKSDNRDLKLIAVVAASLLCIAILAIAKAYIQKAPSFFAYIKIVMYYVLSGLAVSGVSYIAGDLIKKALEKLGWFKSSVAVELPILEI